jgi:hypothetical protein
VEEVDVTKKVVLEVTHQEEDMVELRRLDHDAA